MSGPLRTKQGCWTCRLRKKKCDERRPYCSTCEALSITCYGFGPKLEWMNNGEKKRAVANSLKEIVKHTSRRKATAQHSTHRDSIIRIAPKSSKHAVESSSSDPRSTSKNGITPPLSDHEASRATAVNILQDESVDFPSSEHDDRPVIASITSIPADESVLLMHFLDNVFPLQYPMYNPGIPEGGRGWLLALLIRTKPLYHAALALSTYHRRTNTPARISQSSRIDSLVQQEKHLGICIKMVNEFAQNSCPYITLGVVASVVQLAFFELFTGYGNAWQKHFRAAMSIYQRAFTLNLSNFGLTDKSRTILCEDLPLMEDDPAVVEQVVNFRFLSGTLIWLDITSSITTGTAPYLLPFHSRVLAPTSQTKFEEIMGCKNWAMLQIGRIAALHEHKTQALLEGQFDFIKFEETVSNISKDIQCCLAQEALEGFKISERKFSTTSNAMLDAHKPVTQIFAHMASIYLHLVTHGFQKMEILDTTVSEATRTLRTHIPKHLLPALVSPIYIIGSVARGEDEQFFRDIFCSPPLLDPLLKHRGRILQILEEIWRKRQIIDDVTWKDNLELSYDILLL